MSKKLMPYAIFSLLIEVLSSANNTSGSTGYFLGLSILLLAISLISDSLKLYKKFYERN